MLIASVVLFDSVQSYDKPYDYAVPKGLKVLKGCRVLVPFGKQKLDRIGFVLSLREEEKDGLKEISSCIDFKPLLNSEGLYLVDYLHEVTFCKWYEAVKCQIPPGLGMKISMGYLAVKGMNTDTLNEEEKSIYEYLLSKKAMCSDKLLFENFGIKEETQGIKNLIDSGFVTKGQLVKKKILDKKAVMARLLPFENSKKLSKRQKEIAELLNDVETASVKELCYFTGCTAAVLKTMQKNGIVELFEEIVPEKVSCSHDEKRDEIELTASQQQVFDSLKEKIDSFSVNLLYGVTGSGKTGVFIKLIEETVKKGKQALILIPEISLTPQTAEKFKGFFGNKVAVLNSTLSMSERISQYNLIKEGKLSIVVGTRLSVFSPLSNIGLIVIDEEQEGTYHSEMAPRFDARKVSQVRAKRHNCPLLLCSATPSVESFYFAQTGKYNLFKLKERFSGNTLPPVEMIDMIAEPLASDSLIFSQRLCREIDYNLEHKEQTILLLNRRGYSTKLTCVSCREIIKCPNCSVAMTFHSANGRLVCHSCGYQQNEVKKCPACNGEMLRYNGEGTQRAEDELKKLFPSAKILRMDADTTVSKNSHEKGFEDFKNGNYDIMVGTQMISKGLNFPLVTLVGILNADQSLFSEDFRSFEKTFSLITQTVGRAGRGEKEGRAFIQTFSPDLDIFKFCKKEDYESFYKEEIAFRKAGLYPPFCDIVKVSVKDEHEQECRNASILFANIFSQMASQRYNELPIRVLGPCQAMPFKRNGSYYMQMLIKCRIGKTFLELLNECCSQYNKEKIKSSVTIDTYYI